MRHDGQRVGIADWRSARPVFLALLLFALCLVAHDIAVAQGKPPQASRRAPATDHRVYLPLAFEPGGCDVCFNATIPDTPFPDPDPADFHFVGDDLAISTRELLLVFRETTTVEEANTLLAGHDATVVGGLPQAALLLVRVPPASLNAMMALLAALNADPRVEVALPEMGGRPAILPPHNVTPDEWEWQAPPDPSGRPTSGNWGLKLIRAPQMWNLDTFVRRTRTRVRVAAGVVDDGFTDEAPLFSGGSRHPDLEKTLRIGARIPVRDHGTMVAGIIGADAENGQGVEGIDPWIDTIHGRAMVWDFGLATWGRQLDAILRVVRNDRSAKAVNNSYALSSFYLGNALSPGLVNYGDVDGDNDNSDEGEWGPADLDDDGVNDTWGDVLDFFGSFYKSRVDRFVEGTFGRDDFFIVAAAGNTGRGYHARFESPIGNAAARFGGHFVAVESLGANNRRSAFSVTGGTIAAPGECIRTTEAPDGSNADDAACDASDAADPLNGTASGTSFSAPYVTGLITALWKLEPALTVPDVRTLLTGAAFTANVAGAVPPGRRIDAFAAAMGIDRIRGTKTLQAALVDVDDGTRDGNQLVDPLRGQPDDTIATADQRRGDGRVTMRDFRAWRDAYLQTHGDEFPGGIALAGSPAHFKKDLNLDGCVGTRVAIPPHPVDVPAPSSCANAPDSENVFSRYDFNGDGRIATWSVSVPFKDDPSLRPGTNDAFVFQAPPGRLRDVDVLGDGDLWQNGEVDGSVENVVVHPVLEGQEPDGAGWGPYHYLLGNRDPRSAPPALKQLPDYLHSFDLHLGVTWDAIATDYEAIVVEVAAEMRAGFAQRFTREIELRPGEQPPVLTVPLWTGRVRVSLDGIDEDEPRLGPDDPGFLAPDALEWSGVRFGEDRGLVLPRLFTTLVDDVAPCQSSTAVDGAGNITVAYEVCVSSAPDGSESRELYLARSTDGGASFTSRLLVSGAVRNHALAVAPNGDIYVAYVQGNPSEPAPPGNASVQFIRSTDGGQSLSAPARLSTPGATNVDSHIDLALDGSSKIYALWAESGSDGGSEAAKNPHQIRLRTSSSRGARFAPPVTLHSDPDPGRRWWPRMAQLAVTPAGEVHAIWHRCNASDAVSCLDFGLLYSRSLGRGGFSEPVEIVSNEFLGAYGYDLAVDAAGQVSVVYGGAAGSNSTIVYIGVRDGVVSTRTNISNTPAGRYAFFPTVVADAAGTVWVAWSETPRSAAAGGPPSEIFVSRSTDGGGSFSATSNASRSASSPSSVPALALDTAGLPLLLWGERSPPSLLVRPVPARD